MEQNKEDILKSKWNLRYAIPMPFGYEAIYEAMEEYAEQWKSRYDELKAELKDNKDSYQKSTRLLLTEHAALKAKAQRLVDALEWYADDGNYFGDNGELATAWEKNMSKKAKASLQDWQNKEGV